MLRTKNGDATYQPRVIPLYIKTIVHIFQQLNPLPNDKFLYMTKLKASAYDKLNVAKMTIPLCDRVENTVGKEENAGYQHFLLFPQCFPRPSSLGSLKIGIVW